MTDQHSQLAAPQLTAAVLRVNTAVLQHSSLFVSIHQLWTFVCFPVSVRKGNLMHRMLNRKPSNYHHFGNAALSFESAWVRNESEWLVSVYFWYKSNFIFVVFFIFVYLLFFSEMVCQEQSRCL
jgi:hypothetical protein